MQEEMLDQDVQLVYWHSTPDPAVQDDTLDQAEVLVTVWHSVALATVYGDDPEGGGDDGVQDPALDHEGDVYWHCTPGVVVQVPDVPVLPDTVHDDALLQEP